MAAFEQRFSGLEAGQREDAVEAARLESVIAASRQAMAAEGGEGDLVDDALLARRRAERDDLFDVVLADPKTASVNAYRRAVMALDTGGAIKGDIRADLYMGRGTAAGAEAGRVKHVLRLYRLVPILGE